MIHRLLHQMYEAAFASYETDPSTLICTRDREVFEVTTTGATATTLNQPTKPGVMCAVVLSADGGTLTLTVTGGYNADADTDITLADAGDFVAFVSIDVGGSYYWRVVTQEGTNAAAEDFTVDQLTATTATIATTSRGDAVTAEHGAGAVGTAFAPRTYRYTRDGTIITEIHIDLTGLACKGDAAKDAIGLAAGGAAYIGRYVVATCGVVYRVEMTCLEAPGEGTATITSDIDLGAEDAADTAYDGAVDDVVINTGGLAAGKTFVSDTPALTANDYLYLVEGDNAATTGVYNAGQLIVRLFGHALLT